MVAMAIVRFRPVGFSDSNYLTERDYYDPNITSQTYRECWGVNSEGEVCDSEGEDPRFSPGCPMNTLCLQFGEPSFHLG